MHKGMWVGKGQVKRKQWQEVGSVLGNGCYMGPFWIMVKDEAGDRGKTFKKPHTKTTHAVYKFFTAVSWVNSKGFWSE